MGRRVGRRWVRPFGCAILHNCAQRGTGRRRRRRPQGSWRRGVVRVGSVKRGRGGRVELRVGGRHLNSPQWGQNNQVVAGGHASPGALPNIILTWRLGQGESWWICGEGLIVEV